MDDKRQDEIARWWELARNIVAFLLGMVILIWTRLSPPDDWRVLAVWMASALGLMGPVVAAGVAQIVAAFRGGPHG
jgi:hypothetical protein